MKYDDVTRAAQTGDAVVVHYKGTCEGKPLTDFNPAAGDRIGIEAGMTYTTYADSSGFQIIDFGGGTQAIIATSGAGFSADWVIVLG